jgi:hypothetical protein
MFKKGNEESNDKNVTYFAFRTFMGCLEIHHLFCVYISFAGIYQYIVGGVRMGGGENWFPSELTKV